MKRDMDLIRELLLEIEKRPYKGEVDYFEPRVEGYAPEQVDYHIMLSEQAGLLSAKSSTALSGKITWRVQLLTWDGYEFLDAARDQCRWDNARDIAREKAGSLTFDVLKALLIQLTRQAVGL